MKSEPKAFASLSSGLLARKGAARPAMRPQGFGQGGGSLEDLGWNDMGFEPPKPSSTPLREVHAADEHSAPRVAFSGLTPLDSPVHSQQAQIVNRLHVANELDEPDEAEEFHEEHAELEISPVVEHPPIAFAAPVEEVAPPSALELTPQLEPAPVAEYVVKAEPEAVAPRRAGKTRSAPGAKGKAAFTLRLDPTRHLKLRLACAVGGRSAQQLVTDALDQLLAEMPELDAMAARAKPKG